MFLGTNEFSRKESSMRVYKQKLRICDTQKNIYAERKYNHE